MGLELMSALNGPAKELQNALAQIDELYTPRRPGKVGRLEVILLKPQDLKIRMDGCKNHGRAHLHIDYGKNLRMASYAVNTGEKLAGGVTPYDKKISEWIVKHRDDIMIVWTEMRASGLPEATVAKLYGTTL